MKPVVILLCLVASLFVFCCEPVEQTLSAPQGETPTGHVLIATECSEFKNAVIENIRIQNATLADALSVLAEDFAYDKILVLVKKAEEMITEQQRLDIQ